MPLCAPIWVMPAPINPAPNTVRCSTLRPGAADDKCRWTVDKRDAAAEAMAGETLELDEDMLLSRPDARIMS